MSKKLIKSEIIDRANTIHGNKYDYSLFEDNYKNNKSKIKIICPVHGIFEKTINEHLSGGGCKLCSYEKLSNSTSHTQEEFIKRASKIHNNKYDYSLVKYKSGKQKISIICPIHGVFEQLAGSHLAGHGCNKCSYVERGERYRKNTKRFIEDAKKIHGGKYNYNKTKYTRDNDNVNVTCMKHGEFIQLANSHLAGHGCKECFKDKIKKERTLTKDDFIEKASKIHNDKYEYSLVKYKSTKQKINIICPIHGEFQQVAATHLAGHGCNECKKDTLSLGIDNFINRANIMHNNKYNYRGVEYINTYSKIIITCPIHGDFKQTPQSHLRGNGCNVCGNIASKGEIEISEFIKTIYNGNVILNDRKSISPYEIDILLPELNIGIEFNGLYWHSDAEKENNYHLKKLILCNSKNIRLLQIFEDEWKHKNDIIKKKLKSILNTSQSKRIYARNCQITNINNNDFKIFLNKNHIQGATNCSVRYGIHYNNNLIGVMGFRKDGEKWDLNRFASSVQIIGGFSKLLKTFLREYNPNTIYTFADLRYSDRYNNVYLKNGFVEEHISKPNYFYVKNDIRYSRIEFQKHKLNSKLEVFDENLSEVENMRANNYFRIFDCGNVKYLYKKRENE